MDRQHRGDGKLDFESMYATKSSPTISIVIPCLGHAIELDYCLRGLEQQTGVPSFEAIVVDSAADPDVADVAGRHPWVQLLRSDRALTAGAARNLGADSARAEVLAFIDADCIPEPAWLAAAAAAIQSGALVVGGPILDVRPWDFIASTDNRLQFVDFSPWRPSGTHSYIPGTHFAIPRTVLARWGRFDEESAVAQDLLFVLPIATAEPRRIQFSPRMRVRHWGRRTWREFLQHQWHFGRSRAVYRLRMDQSLTWLAERPVFAWLIFLRRLAYLSLRVLQWNALDLPRFLLQMPVLLIGLVAWTRGFYAGMAEISSSLPATEEALSPKSRVLRNHPPRA